MAENLLPEISDKLREYETYCKNALNQYALGNHRECLHNLRISGEAYFKILIFDHYGVIQGLEKIMPYNGRSNDDLTYQGLLDQAHNCVGWDRTLFGSFKDIQKYANNASHDPNSEEKKPAPIHATLCVGHSGKITKQLYDYLGLEQPAELMEMYNNNGPKNPVDPMDTQRVRQVYTSPEWEAFYESTEHFTTYNKYILIAPPSFGSSTPGQLAALTKIDWSFVIDFDPHSQENGLYNVFERAGKNIIPITIKEKGRRDIAGEGYYKINWLFANGVSSIPDTTTADFRGWSSTFDYPGFIVSVLKGFLEKSSDRYVIVYLWEDYTYLQEIISPLARITSKEVDLFRHVVAYQNSELKHSLEQLDRFVPIDVHQISYGSILSGVESCLEDRTRTQSKTAIEVPARIEDNYGVKDISDLYASLVDNHIEIIHSTIHRTAQDPEQSEEGKFYTGEKITWKELAEHSDVRRNKMEELTRKIRTLLTDKKNSVKFELSHAPGAGGTTLSRRLAFEMKKEYPCIRMYKYNRNFTFKVISELSSKVQMPILAFVESSDVNNSELEDLIRKCNLEKRMVVFVYITRRLSRRPSRMILNDSPYSTTLKDHMADIDEKNRFVFKFRNNPATNALALEELESRDPSKCEVIDFALLTGEESYSEGNLKQYISSYINKLPQEQIQFAVYASIVYRYSQKSISELNFRRLFDGKHLSDQLNRIPAPQRYLQKILVQEYDTGKELYTKNWRPRFKKFADIILQVVGGEGTWKDKLPSYSKELIKIFEAGSELNIEIRDLLHTLFLQRNNEDPINTDDEWNPKSNERFSLLIKEIADKDKQKEVFKQLVESYPDDIHFLGHFARFLYEKHENLADLEEAQKYVDQAFDRGAEDDSTLQHIGGMCMRRKIEYYKRNYGKSLANEETDSNEMSIVLKELTEKANIYFERSRAIDPGNIHAYVANIQTLIQVINFGVVILNADSAFDLISDPKHEWFADQFSLVKRLIDEGKYVIRSLETLNGKSNVTKLSGEFISESEGRAFSFIKDYEDSINKFKRLSDEADTDRRPYYRNMLIDTILLKRARGNKNNLGNSWKHLNKWEIEEIEGALNKNILQSTDLYSLRLWLNFVRYSSVDIPIEEVISTLKLWYENSNGNRVAEIESSYYLYAFNAVMAIRSTNLLGSNYVSAAKEYMDICKAISMNTKYAFEWLGTEDGVDALINHKDRMGDEQLETVEGTISNIYSRQQGRITLKCGLEAFFVPSVGGFIERQDETTPVKFKVGFRQEGLSAWNVTRASEEMDLSSSAASEPEVGEMEEIHEVISAIPRQPQQEESYGPKVVGKIDLSKLKH